MQPIDQNQTNIGQRYRTILILWAAMLVSVLSLLLLINLSRVAPIQNLKLSLILNTIGLVSVALSFLIKITILQRAVEGQQLELVQVAYVVAFAFCEASALLGLVDHYLTGSNYYRLGFALGLLGIILHFPRKNYLLAASNMEF